MPDETLTVAIRAANEASAALQAAAKDIRNIEGAGGSAAGGLRQMEGAAGSSGGALGGLRGIISNLTGSLGSALPVIAGFGGALAGAFAIKSAISTVTDLGAEVRKLGLDFGTTSEQSSVLRFQLEETGVGFDRGETALSRFSKALAGVSDMEDGVAVPAGKAMVANLKALGVEADDATGKQRPFNDILGDLAEQFQRMPDGVEKTALATQLFGRTGRDLIPFLDRGREGLAALSDEAGKMGLVLSQGTTDAIYKNQLAMRDFHAALQGISVTIGTAVLPIVTILIRTMTNLAIEINEHVTPIIKLIVGLIRVEFAQAIFTVTNMFDGFNQRLSGVIGFAGGFHVVLGSIVEDFKAFGRGDIALGFSGLVGDLTELGAALPGLRHEFDNFWDIFNRAIPAIEAVQNFVKALDLPARIRQVWADISDTMNKFFGFIGDHPEIMTSLIIGFGAAGAAAAAYGIALGIAAAATTAFGVAAAVAAGAVAILGSPFVLVGLAIAGLVLAGRELVAHWDDLTKRFPILAAGLATVQAAFATVVKWLQDVFLPGFRGVWYTVEQDAQHAWDFISALLRVLAQDINAVLDTIVGFFERHMGSLGDIVRGGWDVIKGIFEIAFALVRGIVQAGWALLHGDASEANAAFSRMFSLMWDGIKEIFSGALKDVEGILGLAWGAIHDIGQHLIQGLWDGISEKFDQLKGWLGQHIGDIGNIAKTVLGISSPSTVFNDIGQQIMSGLQQGIQSGEAPVAQALTEFVGRLTQQAAAFMGGGNGFNAGVPVGNWRAAVSAYGAGGVGYSWSGMVNGVNIGVGGAAPNQQAANQSIIDTILGAGGSTQDAANALNNYGTINNVFPGVSSGNEALAVSATA